MTAVGAKATVPTGDKIGTAAKALSDASYPFLKEAQGCKEDKLRLLVFNVFPGDTSETSLSSHAIPTS